MELEKLRAELEELRSVCSWLDSCPADELLDEQVFQAARISHKRHCNSIRGATITTADSFEHHLIWHARKQGEELKKEKTLKNITILK
jgi:hypothetical protein